MEIAYNKSRVYRNFRLIGFTTVNGEVIRLYITNVHSDSLDKMASSFAKTSNFIEYKKANYIDKTVDDERPVPLWIV